MILSPLAGLKARLAARQRRVITVLSSRPMSREEILQTLVGMKVLPNNWFGSFLLGRMIHRGLPDPNDSLHFWHEFRRTYDAEGEKYQLFEKWTKFNS